MTLGPGGRAGAGLWWTNWCGRGDLRLGFSLRGLRGSTTVDLPAAGPRCDSTRGLSYLSVFAFVPFDSH